MKTFNVEIKKENVEGTTLKRRIAYNVFFGEEKICSVKTVSSYGDMLKHINNKIREEFPYLELVGEESIYGLHNTVLSTVAGIEPAMSLPVFPEEQVCLNVLDTEDTFNKKLDIFKQYLEDLNDAIEAMVLMATNENLGKLFLSESKK